VADIVAAAQRYLDADHQGLGDEYQDAKRAWTEALADVVDEPHILTGHQATAVALAKVAVHAGRPW